MPLRGWWPLAMIVAAGACADNGLAPAPARSEEPVSGVPPVTVSAAASENAPSSVVSPTGEVFRIVRSAPANEPTLYEAEDLDHPNLRALRPLVAAIYRDYGNPTSELARVRVLRDWIARTAIIGMNGFHPDNSTANRSVLPPGATWREVNRRAATAQKIREDADFWWNVGSDGTAMLRELIGERDPVSERWSGGMMEHVGGSRFRIRRVSSYRYPLCTFQATMAVALWNAAGFHASLVQSFDHDGAAVFVPGLSRWIWEDPTYNEDFELGGAGGPLGTLQLQRLGARDSLKFTRSVRIPGPVWDPETYVNPAAYGCCSYPIVTPRALTVVAQQVRNRQAGVAGWKTATYFVSSERAGGYVPLGALPVETPQQLFPVLGARVDSLTSRDTVSLAHLSSTYPGAVRYEMRTDDGRWRPVDAVVALPAAACVIRFRPVTTVARSGAAAVIRRVSPACS